MSDAAAASSGRRARRSWLLVAVCWAVVALVQGPRRPIHGQCRSDVNRPGNPGGSALDKRLSCDVPHRPRWCCPGTGTGGYCPRRTPETSAPPEAGLANWAGEGTEPSLLRGAEPEGQLRRRSAAAAIAAGGCNLAPATTTERPLSQDLSGPFGRHTAHFGIKKWRNGRAERLCSLRCRYGIAPPAGSNVDHPMLGRMNTETAR